MSTSNTLTDAPAAAMTAAAEQRHTPAPWRLESAGLRDCFRIYGPSGALIGHAWSVEGDKLDDGQMKANGPLMAAAPDLLSALRLHVTETGHTALCNEYADQFGGCVPECQQTLTAIRKATGGQS